MAVQAGQQIGEYRVTGRLGAGAMGTVYAGEQPVIGKKVAIKVLNAELARDETAVKRFVQEARAVNQIRHPNIVDIFSFGTLPDGAPYFVMEQLPGKSLGELLAERRTLTPVEVCSVLRPVAEAVDIAHQHGIVHRDLKPDNIFVVDLPGGRQTVKVLDFGVAKLTTSTMTATKGLIGTPLFMAPEQCTAQGVDHRADIYALGVIAYHALTGRFPHEADSVVQLVSAHLQRTQPPPPSSHGAPPALDAAIMQCLAWDPAERPATMTAALQSIVAASGATRTAAPAAAPLAGPGAPTAIGLASTAAAPASSSEVAFASTVAAEPTSTAPAKPVGAAASLVHQSTLGAAAGVATTPATTASAGSRGFRLWIAMVAVAVVAAGVVSWVLVGGDGENRQSHAAAPVPAANDPVERAAEEAPAPSLDPPRVAIAEWSTSPETTSAALRAELATALPAFQDCYVRRLVIEPSLVTRADLVFRVDRRGRPQSVSVSSADAELAACVSESISKLRFPKPPGKKSADVRGALRFYRSADAPPPEDAELAVGEADPPRRSDEREHARRAKAPTEPRPSREASPRPAEPEQDEDCDAAGCILDPNRPCCAAYNREREADRRARSRDDEAQGGFRPKEDLPVMPTRIDITNGISRVRGDLASCADATGFQGRVSVKIRIAPSGEVTHVDPSGATPEVHACVARVIEDARFPESQRGLTIRYPLWLE